MFIAKSIREKSVVEYLLYMWQMEDLIRAYGCSLTRIRREYIDRFEYTDQQKDEEEDWFGDLIRMMNQEGKREKGHPIHPLPILLGRILSCATLHSGIAPKR